MEIGSIHQPLNREVLLYLMTLSAVYNRISKHNPPPEPEFLVDLELRELRTHPDLGGLLYGLSQEIPGAFHGYVLGYNVLVNSRGVIFAIATSMMGMAFRVNPSNDQGFPQDEKTCKIETLSREWQSCSPFGQPGASVWLRPIAERALANVEMLSDRGQ